MSRSVIHIAIAAILASLVLGNGTSSDALGATAAPAGPAAARKSDEENAPQQVDKRSQKMEAARIADEKRKAEEKHKQEEQERLVREAEEDRKLEAIRLAQEKKKKEQHRQPVDLAPRCVLKPVMTDAEIGRCR